MIVCPTCGTQNPDTAKFCSECGTRLQPATPASPPPASPGTMESQSPELAPSPAEEPESEATPTSEERDISAAPKKDTSGLPPAWMPPPVTLQSRPSREVYPSSPPAPSPAPEPAVETPISTSKAEKDTSGLPPVWMPPPVTPTFQGGGSGGEDGDWKMSDLGPVPERRNRRLWLWIPIGLMSFVLICCIAVFIWSATIGEDTVNRWATEAAVERTEEALSGEGD